MMKSVLLLSIFLLIVTTFVIDNVEAQKYMPSLYEWKYLDFQFPERDNAIRNGTLKLGSPFLLDIDVYYGGSAPKYFVTMPRFYDGTAVTLGTITGYPSSGGGPLIAPFPSYAWQQSGCNAFTNVFRVFVDDCDRLWVLDSGVINDQQVCQAKLFIFNLKSATLDYRVHPIPTSFYRSTATASSLFVTIVVDKRSCVDSMAYIADVTGYGIIVYDFYYNKSWRTQSSRSPNLHSFDSRYSTFYIGGQSFMLEDGVFGLALSPKTYSNRQLFHHSLASFSENRVPLGYLDNSANWPTSVMSPDPFLIMGTRENTQTTVQAMDNNGNLFFGIVNPPGIGCWDSSLPYIPANLKLVSRSDTELQFPSGLKIVNCPSGQELWVLSNRFQKIMNGRSTNEVNYRVKKMLIYDLLNGSYKCNGPIIPRS